MVLIDGKHIASVMKEEVKQEVAELAKLGVKPCLAIVQVGNDPASSIYVRNKKKLGEELGYDCKIIQLPEETSEEQLIKLIRMLNVGFEVNGILVQLPLPKHINEEHILNKIEPIKDVDCFTYRNVATMWTAKKHEVNLKSCTPAACIELLKRYNIPISGKHVVIIGRSNIVGKPLACLALLEDATVTVCHSRTQNLQEICKTADILIVAIGKKHFVNKDFIKPGAVVIDVGINRDQNNKICGDVNFEDVKDIVSAISPVPGGVGPMTVMILMKNLIYITKEQQKLQNELMKE